MEQQPNELKNGEEPKPQEHRNTSTLWAIGTGSLAGGVIGIVLADEIQRGLLTVALFLPIAVLLLAGYTGRARVIRLITAAIVAAFVVILILLLPQ